MGRLRLEVRDFGESLRWRWLLSDEDTGVPLADHQVDLAGVSGEFAAFADLYRYLRWNAVPDRRAVSEAEIAGRVGAWAGEAVLGRAVGEAIVAAAPVTVRVVVPERAGFVLSWPLELAYAGGRPLAARGDVTLAYDLAPDPASGAPGPGAMGAPAGGALRMLGVFSLPTATSVLALRRERFELVRLVRRIAARQRRRVELTVVQYGATRERLAAVAEAGDGWDVLHLSGHGGRGQFLLESADGSPDPVDTGELTGLLAPLRGRVRLAVVSACESAAATTAETLRWVGLEEQAEQFEEQAGQDAAAAVAAGAGAGGGAEPVMTGVARAVAARLGCAVVAMRYPVADDFAVAFAEELYERLLGVRDAQPGSQGQPLDVRWPARWRSRRARSRRRRGRCCRWPRRCCWAASGRRVWCWRCRAACRTWTLDWCGCRRSRPSRSGSSAGPRRWRGPVECWPRAAGRRGCCCTGWPGRARRRARWSWPTGIRTRSPPPRSGRRRS